MLQLCSFFFLQQFWVILQTCSPFCTVHFDFMSFSDVRAISIFLLLHCLIMWKRWALQSPFLWCKSKIPIYLLHFWVMLQICAPFCLYIWWFKSIAHYYLTLAMSVAVRHYYLWCSVGWCYSTAQFGVILLNCSSFCTVQFYFMSFSNNTSRFPFCALLVDVINSFAHCYFTLLWCYNIICAALLGDVAALRIFFVVLFDCVKALLIAISLFGDYYL